MTTANERNRIQEQVELVLPHLAALPNEDLEQAVGQLALGDVAFARPPSKQMLRRAGSDFVQTHTGLRDTICSSDNKTLITTTIDATSVSSLLVIMAPVLGFPPAAVPAAVIALAVLILRIGVNQYCRGYAPGSS